MQRASHAEPDEDNRKFRVFGCTRSAAGFLVRSQSFRPLIGMKEGKFQSGAAASCESEDCFSVAESHVCSVQRSDWSDLFIHSQKIQILSFTQKFCFL